MRDRIGIGESASGESIGVSTASLSDANELFSVRTRGVVMICISLYLGDESNGVPRNSSRESINGLVMLVLLLELYSNDEHCWYF